MSQIKLQRGTKDIFGTDARKYNFITKVAQEVFERFGYERIITPTFESTTLFQRGIGEDTDIVEKEMYTFLDKGNRSITLRPEGTASVVRSYLEHKMYGQGQLKKFYYFGQMFRYERPQAGRYREFNQVGVESIGSNSTILDAEIILMCKNFIEKLGITDINININSIGCNDCRNIYKQKLVEFLDTVVEELCEDCKKRYRKNPLRVLDCKETRCVDIIKEAPMIIDYLDDKCKTNFDEIKRALDIMGIDFIVNPKLVRGLDYYTNIVFEIITDKLGAQGTILGGGRYNKLLEEIGDKDMPAVGFAAGIERLMMLMDDSIVETQKEKYSIVWQGEKALRTALKCNKLLREKSVVVEMEYENKSFKAQMKKASKTGVDFCIIIGDTEAEGDKVIIKSMKTGEQIEMQLENL